MSHHNRKKAMGQALLFVSWTARAQTLTLRELEGLTLCFSLQGGGRPSIALQGEALLQHPEEACCNELVCSAGLEKIQMWPPTLRNKAFTSKSARQDTNQPIKVCLFSPYNSSMAAAPSNQAHVRESRKRNGRVPRTPEWGSCQRSAYVTLVKCHVQTAARLISVSRLHALLIEAGITRKAVSAACAYMFLWSHPLPLDKAEKKLQIFASIFGLLLCENVHVQKDRRINVA